MVELDVDGSKAVTQDILENEHPFTSYFGVKTRVLVLAPAPPKLQAVGNFRR